jgi:hypothetical protein
VSQAAARAAGDARLALFTVVHPASLPFFRDFYDSVAAQTDPSAELVVVTDGVAEDELGASAGRPVRGRVLPARPGATPAALRQEALLPLCARVDGVVLADSDDVLHPRRVALARAALRGADVTASAMTLVDEGGAPLGARFGAGDHGAWHEALTRWNVFGFGNGAYRSRLLADCLPVPEDTVMMDWLVVTRALARGARLHFDELPSIDYRIHGSSLAHVLPPFTAEELALGARRVRAHLERAGADDALDAPTEAAGRLRRALVGATEELERFEVRVLGDPDTRARYLEVINRGPAPPAKDPDEGPRKPPPNAHSSPMPAVYRWWEWIASRRHRQLWTL